MALAFVILDCTFTPVAKLGRNAGFGRLRTTPDLAIPGTSAMVFLMNIQTHTGLSGQSADATEYSTDIHAWANAQRDALERRDVSGLDWDNLAEEIGDLGNSQLAGMENRLATILEHLLKYEFGLVREPARGWKRTIVTQRSQLARHLKRNPSLAARLDEIAREVYGDARRDALAAFEEYEPDDLSLYAEKLPLGLPYAAAALLDQDFLPAPVAR